MNANKNIIMNANKNMFLRGCPTKYASELAIRHIHPKEEFEQGDGAQTLYLRRSDWSLVQYMFCGNSPF